MQASHSIAIRPVDSRERRVQEGETSLRASGESGAPSPASTSSVNVNTVERSASVLLGATLLALGLKRASAARVPLAVGGGLLLYRGFSGSCPAYRALGLSSAADEGGAGATARLALPHRAKQIPAPKLERSITIRRPAEELSRLWKDPHTLSRVLGELASVKRLGADQLEWQLNAKLGKGVRLKTRWVEAGASALTWESLPGDAIRMRGSLHLSPAPSDWGTVVNLRLELEPEGSGVKAALTQLLGSVPSKLVLTALRRFKSLAEAGEIPTTDKNPTSRDSGR